jgi:hypothetical protein
VTNSQEGVTPVNPPVADKTRGPENPQRVQNTGSGFRRNDGKKAFYEFIRLEGLNCLVGTTFFTLKGFQGH